MSETDESQSAEISFEEREGYLYALVRGERDSLEVSREYWQRVIDECNRRSSEKVLIEEDFPNQLDTMEMFDLVVEITKMLVNPLKIAFVDRDLTQHELNRFAESVAINRGVFGRVFRDRESAAEWLLS